MAGKYVQKLQLFIVIFRMWGNLKSNPSRVTFLTVIFFQNDVKIRESLQICSHFFLQKSTFSWIVYIYTYCDVTVVRG